MSLTNRLSRSSKIMGLIRHNTILNENNNDSANASNNNTELFRESPVPDDGEHDLENISVLLKDVFDDSPECIEIEKMGDQIDNERNEENLDPNIIPCNNISSPLKPVTSVPSPVQIHEAALSAPSPAQIHEATIPVLSSIHINEAATPVPSPAQIHEPCNSTFCALCTEDIILIAPDDLYGNLPTPSVSSIANSVTPSSTKSKKKRTYKTDKGKKRLPHKGDWIVVKSKLLKNQGKTYTNQKGKTFSEKVMKRPCSCRIKCFEAFTEEQRLDIFNKFWALGDRNKQWDYMIKYTKKQTKKRQTTEVTLHNRQFSFFYFLPFGDNQSKKVCQTMFLNTLAVGERIVKTAWEKYDGSTSVDIDRRGKYDHKKTKLTEAVTKSICDHVNAFAPVESHYVRKRSHKLYLEEGLSVSRMYKLYCEWFDPNAYDAKAQTLRQYRDVVNSNFNLGFHIPKKDCCDVCHIFQNNAFPNEQEKAEFMLHQKRKKTARNLKNKDKEEAVLNNNILAATFDFQKVLTSPHGEVSVFYYKRKLSTYNFTVFNMGTKDATCYMWHEGIAKRGSNEVSSCLFNFIKEHKGKGVTEFRFWSDNCSGQNRNRIVFLLYLLAAKEFGVTIIHRFLEKGHTQNEGDSVHSVIERASERKLIYVPDEWYCLVRWAKSSGNSYVAKEMETAEFFDFKALLAKKNWVKSMSNEKVRWTAIREVKVVANSYDRIEFRYELDADPQTIVVLRTSTRNTQRLVTEFDLKPLYSGPLPIQNDKYKDLIFLCQAGIIPVRHHNFFKSLRHLNLPNQEESQNDSSDSE